jgi:Flp pilus assembly protein TadG
MRNRFGSNCNWTRIGRRFTRNDEGGVAIYVALISAVMLGFGALVVDLGRLFTLQTELQNAADASALAGAAELDGTAGSIARAKQAARDGLIGNGQTFATGGTPITILDADIRILTALPATDDDPVTDSLVTAIDQDARFIEVTATTRQVAYFLAPVLARRPGGDGTAPTTGNASAVAVAGFNQAVCRFPPLMICNPAEAGGNTGAPFSPVVGEIIRLKSKASSDGSQWTPGNFGLLDPPIGNAGAENVSDQLAKSNPDGCFSSSVTIRTGQAENPVGNAINVRFDMYEAPHFGGNAKNNSEYRPATNVTKGKYVGGSPPGWNNYPAGSPPAGMAIPTHSCFPPDNCAGTTATNHPNFGPPLTDAEWDDYWAVNHPTLNTPNVNDYDHLKTNPVDLNSDGVATPLNPNGDGIVTRKEMYDWEIAEGQVPDNTASDGTSTSTAENGKPKYYGGSTAPDPERRTVHVAVINCIDEGPITGAAGGPYNVLNFAKMFIVRPVEDPEVGGLYVEVIGVLQPGVDDDVLHDIVQLYR